MRFKRRSGVFLHLTSLPGLHGVGDLGRGAREFLDFLDRADQSLWQFCPLGPTAGGRGNSPYQSHSAFAGAPLLIDLEDVADRGLLDAPGDLPAASPHEVRYDRVRAFKRERLREAFERFDAGTGGHDAGDSAGTGGHDAGGSAGIGGHSAFEQFREREADWLADYALFAALNDEHDGRPWTDWPEGLVVRDPDALERARDRLAREIRYHEFVQWLFDEQWRALAGEAAERGVKLVGDLPLYVALDSADVWASPEAFRVADGEPTAVAGVPPNPEDDGQRWGNPVYDWDHLADEGYDWWLRRLERLFDLVDIARIDHFKGFDEFWAIPADSDDPADGEWRPGPGADFFETVRAELGDLPFVVENLGFLDEGVAALRDRFDLPGMRVPHYAGWCREGDMYQPMHYPEDCAGYTSTHDTDTAVGYYRDLPPEQRECLRYNLGTDGEEIHWDLIEAVWNSNAVLALTTVQDLLGLGSEARLNTPGTAEGNWRWRVTSGALDPAVADRLRRVTDATVR